MLTKVPQVPYYGMRAQPEKQIGDIWDENLILANRRIKDRDLKTYHIGNFDIDKEINKVFSTSRNPRRSHAKAVYSLI